jgi:hypothetical protein
MMDLSKLDTKTISEKGAKLYFVAPNGRETTFFMEVLGPDSKLAINKVNEAVLEYVNNKKDSDEDEEKVIQDMESLLENQEKYATSLFERVIGWGDHEETKSKDPKKGTIVNTILWGEDKLEFSKENVLKVLDACPWMKEQISSFMGKRANFLQA